MILSEFQILVKRQIDKKIPRKCRVIECNCLKNDEKFFYYLIDKCECKPEEILHIDDKDGVKGLGEKIGINVIIYHAFKDFSKLLTDLQSYGVSI